MSQLLRSLQRGSATLFLVAGGLLVLFALLLGVEAVTGGSAPEDLFGPAGYAVAFMGLLGLYPSLADRSRGLAVAGAVAAVISAIGWVVLTVLSILEVAGALSAAPEEGALGGAALAAAGVGMILGYPLFGAATIRSEVHSRSLGFLLLTPTVIFLLTFAVLAPLGLGEGGWGPFGAATAQALAHLAIGMVVRKEHRAWVTL